MDRQAKLQIYLKCQEDIRSASTLKDKLTAIATGVVQAGPFRRALLTVYPQAPIGRIRGGAGLTAEELAYVENHETMAPRDYREMARRGRALGFDAYHIPHERISDLEKHQMIQSHRPPESGGWHPDDLFLMFLKNRAGETIGSLSCDDPVGGTLPSDEDLEILSLFAQRAMDEIELEIMRRTDGLTGLANVVYLNEEAARLEAGRDPFAVVWVDLARFGEQNRRFGRRFGDLLLQEAAAIVGSCTPRGAVACRAYGDDFIVLLPAHVAVPPQEVVEHARILVRRWNVESRQHVMIKAGLGAALAGDPLTHMQMRFGVAVREEGETAEQAFQRAEHTLAPVS